MTKKIASILGLCLFSFLLASPVMADYNNPSSGLQIVVNKEIKSPLDPNWHDNLGSDNAFAANDFIEFRIIVKNTGNSDLTNIQLSDQLPPYIVSIFDPGVYNSSNQTIKWSIDRLTPGEENNFLIKTEVREPFELPNSGTFCNIFNTIYVTDDQNVNDSDSAQFCINPKVLGAKLPETGSPLVTGALIATSLLGLGFVGRKFGRGELFS